MAIDQRALEAARQAWLESASDYTRLDDSIRAAILAYEADKPVAPMSTSGEMVEAVEDLRGFADRHLDRNPKMQTAIACVLSRLEALEALVAEAALAKASGDAEVVPAGFKLVPLKPTPKMLEDAAFNLADEFGADFVKPLGEFAKAVYDEMLSAAPSQPAALVSPDGEG